MANTTNIFNSTSDIHVGYILLFTQYSKHHSVVYQIASFSITIISIDQ